MQFWHIVNTDILKSQVLHHLFNVYLTWLTQLYDLIFLCVISFPLHSFQSCLHSFGSFFFNCFFLNCASDFVCVCLVAQSCPTLCDPMDCSPPGSSAQADSSGKNTGVGCHALLQGIFPTQGSNLSFPYCGQILYCLSHQTSPLIL